MAKPSSFPGVPASRAALLALLVLVFGSGAASAEAVAVDIGVVVASHEGTVIDPALSALKPKLQSMFPYSSYRMIDRMRKTLAVGETGEFSLPGNRTIRVTPAPPSRARIRLDVQVMEGARNLLTTTLGMSRGGMVIVAGPPYRSGVLILLISAE
jgi:hypothetical protein